uniref:Uncharacterized protein n=1 Tax=Arundo donax TaxID=35708 RepID=A0A0A9HAF2_ARUDO
MRCSRRPSKSPAS